MSVVGDSRSQTLASDWLEDAARSGAHPQAWKDALTDMQQAVHKKLWHQLGVQLLSVMSNPALSGALLPLQEHVVSKLYKKLAPLSYVRWSVAAANAMSEAAPGGPNVAVGLKHLESVLPHVSEPVAGQQVAGMVVDPQAVLLLQLEITRRLLSTGTDPDTIKDRLTDSKKALDTYSGVMDARVYAAFYQAHYEYDKLRGNPQEYYTNSLLYLTYTPLADIPPATRAGLASDIGLAALLGVNIYNFGELLQHPILASLDDTEYSWLPRLLKAFNAGNIPEFNTVFAQVKDKYPTLAANAVFLNQKLRIMTLMELVFRMPSGKSAAAPAASSSSATSSSAASPAAPAVVPSDPDSRGRVLSFDLIARECDLPRDQVEWLLMKALALKVIRGQVDQVAATVRVHWVAPRVLDRAQIQSLQARLAKWQSDVEQTTVFVENNAQAVIGQ